MKISIDVCLIRWAFERNALLFFAETNIIAEFLSQTGNQDGDSMNFQEPNTFAAYFSVRTVYDPKVYSDQQIIQWGKEAMQEGIDANRVKKGGLIEGYSLNGMKFLGYLNDQGKIKSFYPAIGEE